MTEYIWKHLPYAIYLDTNALYTAGAKLDASWINELLSITTKYGMKVCISELVLAEWCRHIASVLESNRKKLLSSVALLMHYGIPVPDIKPNEIDLPEMTRLAEVVSNNLKTAGFDVIRNWDTNLSQLLTEAIAKKPPFEERGKGLCDVVILESYAKHAQENFDEPRVLVVSHDNAVNRSGDRFTDRGIVVDFVDEQGIVEKLKSLLKDEVAAYIEHQKRKLTEYVLQYEATILEFVRTTPFEITDWMLNSPFTAEEDRIFGTIESILSVRPTKITDVIGGVPIYGEELEQGRYPVRISVELELEIVVSEHGLGFALLGQTRAIIQPDMVHDNSPVHLERKAIDWRPREITKTIRIRLTVLASLDAEKEKSGILGDFRIEKIV
jgi:hypothetical protein